LPTERLDVNLFSAATMNWNVHTGHTPWLDNDVTHSISAFTDHMVDDSYTFTNTAILDFLTITSIKLKGQVKSNLDLNYADLLLSGASGGAWNTTVQVFDDAGSGVFIPFESVDLKAIISSLARIDECAMKATKHNMGGAGTLVLTQVYLEIVTAEVGGVIRRLLVKVGL